MSELYGNTTGGQIAGHDQSDVLTKAKRMSEDLGNKASKMAESVMNETKGRAAELGEAAKDTASSATSRVKEAIAGQKGAGADFLGNIAQATRRAANEFEVDVPQAAEYIRLAAGQVETFANAIRERNVGELFDEVQQFARRQPTLFFGGAMVLGFATLRFLKSSTAQAPDRQA